MYSILLIFAVTKPWLICGYHGYKNHDLKKKKKIIFVLMVNFRKGAWKLGENIRCVGGGEIITDIKKTRYYPQHPKKVLHDYECSLPESDARASFSPFLFFPFLSAGLLMSFHGHSCPSIMIICIQPQTCASGSRMREWRVPVFFFFFFFFFATGMVPPWELVALSKPRTLRIGSGRYWRRLSLALFLNESAVQMNHTSNVVTLGLILWSP